MAKKSFKDNTSNINRFFSVSDVPNTDKTHETSDEYTTPKTHDALNMPDALNVSDSHGAQETDMTHDTHVTSDKQYYRFNLKTPMEYKEFLDEASWKRRMNVTQYINSLIKEQMDKEKQYSNLMVCL